MAVATTNATNDWVEFETSSPPTQKKYAAPDKGWGANHNDASAIEDDFEDDAIVGEAVKGIPACSTWVSSSSSDQGGGEEEGDSSCSAVPPPAPKMRDHPSMESDRLKKLVTRLSCALALFVAIAVSLGVALVAEITTDGNDNGGGYEETNNVSVAASSGGIDTAFVDEAAVWDVPKMEEDPLIVESTTPSPSSLALTSKPPTLSPSSKPTTSNPSSMPTHAPTTSSPSNTPTSSPIDPFYYGDLSITNDDLGIEVSDGLSVKLIATAGLKVLYADGEESDDDYHELMDGAGIIPLQEDGGYVYVSNSERDKGKGGVYGMYFDKYGNITQYKALLTGTTLNCGGGLSPWNTWISCEEYSDGQCWQVDPDPMSKHHENPSETNLGSRWGGTYESVAVDNRNAERPVFFVTEDSSDGPLRRVEVNGTGWDSLHENENVVSTSFLHIVNGNEFEWTEDEDDGMDSAWDYFPNAEGISFHEDEGKLYFMSKTLKTLLILDLDEMTYETETVSAHYMDIIWD